MVAVLESHATNVVSSSTVIRVSHWRMTRHSFNAHFSRTTWISWH